MSKRSLLAGLFLLATVVVALPSNAQAQHGGGVGQPADWGRFYHYPYVYYPENFQPRTQYDSLYYRYPPNRRIPVYNQMWYNPYPSPTPYHKGHHFILDVF